MRRHAWACALILPLALAGCIRIAPAIPSWPEGRRGDLVLDARDGLFVSAQINGRPVRLKVETGFSGIIVNPAIARQLSLQPSVWENDLRIGPVRVQGDTSVVSLTVDGQTDSRRLVWFATDVAADADGIINIAAIPAETVTLRFGPPRPDEVAVTLATGPEPGFFSVTHDLQAGDRAISVRFLLGAPRTLLTAAAAAHLAERHGGRWSGEAFTHPIGFGVSRPVRPMHLDRPVSIGGRLLRDVLVRSSDYRGRQALPSDPPADPSEIVVTGNNGRGEGIRNAIVGQDWLAGCSSLTYAGATRVLTLRCVPE